MGRILVLVIAFVQLAFVHTLRCLSCVVVGSGRWLGVGGRLGGGAEMLEFFLDG